MIAQAALFDLDGVLVDSGPYHLQSWQELFREVRQEFTEAQFRRVFGLRSEAIVRRLLGPLPAEEVRRLAARKEELYRAAIVGRIQGVPGAVDLVRRLEKEGLGLAVVTSTPRANVELILRSLGLADAFATIVNGEDVRQGKPDPEGFLLAAQRLGVAPAGCVVLEDAPAGIRAAKAAGMRSIGVATTRPAKMLREADLVIERLDDPRVLSFLLA